MWRAFGASVRGTGHISSGVPCQDAHGFKKHSGYVIAAAADGLGSAPRSDEGSNLAVGAVINRLDESLEKAIPDDESTWKEYMKTAFSEARLAIEKAAASAGNPSGDYGTTLIAAVMTKKWLAVGQIGDGAAVACFDGVMETVSRPQNGEFANVTIPLTSGSAMELLNIKAVNKKAKVLALLTDGVQFLSIREDTGEPHQPFFKPFFDAVMKKDMSEETCSAELADFLGSDRVCAKTNDDKTLLVVGMANENRQAGKRKVRKRQAKKNLKKAS